MVLKRIGVDPAVVSAPFIATFIDGTGLIIYFEIASHTMSVFCLIYQSSLIYSRIKADKLTSYRLYFCLLAYFFTL